MSWGSKLYAYAQSRGGEYFGVYDEWSGGDGTLLTRHKGELMVIRQEAVPQGRGSVSHSAQVLLRCTLERNYKLSITPGHIARQGLKTALAVVNAGSKQLGVDLAPTAWRDYGCPEVLKDRSVSNDNPEFTRQVLGDLELRNCLLAQPKNGLTVRPSAAIQKEGAALHLICASSSLDGISSDWDLAEPNSWSSPEERQRILGGENFAQKLDELIALAAAARNALTAWRMPPL